ncbi:MAG: DUF2922 domain-containing protein [Peptostreptococcaceae bacterium]|nr:DUF2922 domain-containing protein [Peptostreptococcaceae bacterium]
MSDRLEMTFNNNAGTTSKISVDNPKVDLTAVEVQTGMGAIVTANIFDSTGGDLVSAKSARVVSTEINELF